MNWPRPVGPIDAVAVVVPAHNEERHLDACLSSINQALCRTTTAHIRLIVVVLDSCDDESRAVTERRARVVGPCGPRYLVVDTDVRNVGAARALGSRLALEHLDDSGVGASQVWLGHTDADSTVPQDWVVRQLRYANRFDAVAGVVRVDSWTDHPTGTQARFEARYEQRPRWHRPPIWHPHVHGANLGVRGDAYLGAGGFPARSSSEDHALWSALGIGTARRLATRRLWVTTSGRSIGRAPDGFAGHLATLAR